MENLLFEDMATDGANGQHYLVLARKYRPTTFLDIIGQEVLIKTFTNAIASQRIAHAFLLTGIRGVGKTTTARIIARALNCIGSDQKGEITIDPCGQCAHCKAIADDRHQDVIEIDAASNTGVADVREIIENTRYRPISARFKIYIIDEVHMLSNSAFNALLKTLEEPPPHVKFIFATTELRKIPMTILSRCQRFDLKRVSVEDLIAHFRNVLNKEGVKSDDDSLRMIANAAHGSVRDGLSILDQAIVHTQGNITSELVREMLGLSSNEEIYNLYDSILKAQTENALQVIERLYAYGVDPMVILQDLMEITHVLSKAKALPEVMESLPEFEKKHCAEFLKVADIARLNRIWMALIKGVEEMKIAPNSLVAIEMIVIRVVHLSNLPSPEEIIKRLKKRENDSNSGGEPKGGAKGEGANTNLATQAAASVPATMAPVLQGQSGGYTSLEEIAALLFEHDEILLCHHLRSDVRLVSLEGNRLAVKILNGAPKNLSNSLKTALDRITGDNWIVINSEGEGQKTISEKEKHADQMKVAEVKNHPTIEKMLNSFTGLEIADIKFKDII